MDMFRGCEASQEILYGIPIDLTEHNFDVLDSPFFCSGVVHIPGEISDFPTIFKLTKLNHFLVMVRNDFDRGVIHAGYTQYLQRELNQTTVAELPAKLDLILNREYANLCYNYPYWYYQTFGRESPIKNFSEEYASRFHYYSSKALEGDSFFSSQMWVDFQGSPLEQFSILPLIPIQIGNLYFSFTNPSLFMLLTLSLVLLFVHFVTKKGGGNSVPNAWQSLVELIYDFVPNLGMIPYSFTVTSHFLITLGVPLPLAPFLVLLELIPHCFRALSLGIRLFANMMAGHSSVKILSGSAWTMLCMNDLFYFIGDPGPLFIVLALTGLELGVAISQAHVSTISICIYLNDATNLHQSAYFFIIEQKRGTNEAKRSKVKSLGEVQLNVIDPQHPHPNAQARGTFMLSTLELALEQNNSLSKKKMEIEKNFGNGKTRMKRKTNIGRSFPSTDSLATDASKRKFEDDEAVIWRTGGGDAAGLTSWGFCSVTKKLLS
ncbi:ATP synthase subunit a [Striga asiatica]|uniref:F-ATPase protein 6 n=1 Tax=Striga asiatica TaxID=4170 RepID=A0A5A7Q089_STRAF|nr:ATP synthase subunit a [Striga asiatica]